MRAGAGEGEGGRHARNDSVELLSLKLLVVSLQCTKQVSRVTKTLCAKVKIIPCLFCNTAVPKNSREEREIEIYYLFIVC